MSFLNYLPNKLGLKLSEFYFKTRRSIGTKPGEYKFSNMLVKILPALQDNYMYLLICSETKNAAVIDPVDPEAVLSAVEKEQVNLVSVLTTHHHWDHAGGNSDLIKKLTTAIPVYGGDDRIGALTNKVVQGQTINLGNLKITCLSTPCHTIGHICYYVESPTDRCVFTGDTLFQGGCGRFFEGTPEQMYSALIEKLSKLPDDTKVFCGHEYTLQNMAFAKNVEPSSVTIAERIRWAEEKRAQNLPTVPSTIGEEKAWNPFMRVHVESVQSHAGESDPIKTMGSLRKEKDSFKA